MLTIQNLSYILPDNETLFDNINLNVNSNEKMALIGNNGTGKSTLLKIIAGILQPSHGTINLKGQPYYIPQIYGQFDHLSVSEALGVVHKLNALQHILDGDISEENYSLLNNDWTIEERCLEAFAHWHLSGLSLSQKIGTLSGGQKMKVFLSGISIHQPDLLLLDEPSNHLDLMARKALYDFIRDGNQEMIVVSHDKKLLNLLSVTCELHKHGINVYGGNFDFYASQKAIETNALIQDIHSKEKELKKATEKARETKERQQKADSRGKKAQTKAGTGKGMMDKMKNDAENSTSKIKSVHTEKLENISEKLSALRSSVADIDKIKLGFNNSHLIKGKALLTATDINYSYDTKWIWNTNQNIRINSGERIAISGNNGSGKTTLVKMSLGQLKPQTGTIFTSEFQSVYIDQDYSLIDDNLNIYQQAQSFNDSRLQEHEIKLRLHRFLFTKDDWDKPCRALSGGERMRLLLCCMSMSLRSPDLIILDEPTNNLDIKNIDILTAAIKEYNGTLLVISHDETFLTEINIERTIEL